jgi:hypothetical protein
VRPSALVHGDQGLTVRRFRTSEAAQAAQANIESDGSGAPLMAVVCAWCQASLGAVVCAPAMAGQTSHGICPACKERVLGTLPDTPGSSCAVSSATAGRDRHSFDAASPLARCETTAPLGEKGIVAPSPQPEHGSDDPAASNHSHGLWGLIDRLIKRIAGGVS